MKDIKVILVDDHAVVRTGYKILLSESNNIKVIAETRGSLWTIQKGSEPKYGLQKAIHKK